MAEQNTSPSTPAPTPSESGAPGADTIPIVVRHSIPEHDEATRGHFVGRAGYLWSFAMSGGQAVATTVTAMVVAALVGPEPYGLIAMALVYVLFVQMLLQQGLGAALVQRAELSDDHLDSAFTFLLGAAIVMTGLTIALSGWWAGVNGQPDLQPVIIALAALVPLQALMVVPEAILLRRLQFKALAVRTNLAALAGGLLGVALAIAGLGVWALVVQQLATPAIELVVLWISSGWIPRLRFERSAARELVGFSSGTFLASIGVFAGARADALVMGLFFGPTAVGLFRFAYRLVYTLLDVVQKALSAVALPALARHQKNMDMFRVELRRIFRVAATVTLPALGMLAACAGVIVNLAGPEWGSATIAIRLLCLEAVGAVLTFLTGPVLQALGRPFRYAWMSWMVGIGAVASFTIIGFVLEGATAYDQVLAISATSAALYAGLFMVIFLRAILRASGLGVLAVWQDVRGPLGVGCVAFLTGMGLELLGIEDSLGKVAAALVVGTVSGLATLGAARFLAPQMIQTAVAVARRRPSALGLDPDVSAVEPAQS